jgi:hypothetical protein
MNAVTNPITSPTLLYTTVDSPIEGVRFSV